MQYDRNDIEFQSAACSAVRGDVIDILPGGNTRKPAIRVELSTMWWNPCTSSTRSPGRFSPSARFTVFPSSHTVTPARHDFKSHREKQDRAARAARVGITANGKLSEAQRLEQRTPLRPGNDAELALQGIEKLSRICRGAIRAIATAPPERLSGEGRAGCSWTNRTSP